MTEKTLDMLAADRIAEAERRDWIRASGPAYDAAIAPAVLAAHEAITDRRRVAADDETLPALRAALAEVNAVVARLAGHAQRDHRLDVLLRDVRGTLMVQVDLLTDGIERDGERLHDVASPSLSELKTWNATEFQRVAIERLHGIKGAEGIAELLSTWWPAQRSEIQRRLLGAAPPPSSTIAPEPPAPRVQWARTSGGRAWTEESA